MVHQPQSLEGGATPFRLAPEVAPQLFYPPAPYIRRFQPGPRERLQRLLEALDRGLDAGPRVEQTPDGHRVWLFDAVGYRIDRERRRILALSARRGERHALLELHPPLLVKPHVVWEVFWRQDLDYPRDSELDYETLHRIECAEDAIVSIAWNRLRRDPRFRELRERTLPTLLGLDPQLLRITLRARTSLDEVRVPSDRYERVWRDAEAFRRLDRENPQLVALALAARENRSFPRSGDDLCKLLHDDLRSRGLSEAAWRRVAREGDRLFRGIWRDARPQARYAHAVLWLHLLDRAGLPPTPPGELAWVVQEAARRQIARLRDASIVADLLREARRLRASPAYGNFREEAGRVLRWAGQNLPPRDRMQRRAGWAWLAARAREWDRDQTLKAANGIHAWPVPLVAHEAEGLRFEPICDIDTLCAEAAAMRNCLRDYAMACAMGDVVLFVIRDAASGRRLAQAALQPTAGSPWEVQQVSGFANAEVSKDVCGAVRRLCERLPREEINFPPGVTSIEQLFEQLQE